ncbi:MAG: hypothetical protein ACI9I0_000956 [Rhodoferax sp.]|jgi:hypothetical protein
MLRWLLLIFLGLLLINGLTPWLHKLGLCRLPGDFSFRFLGRAWYFPFSSMVLFALVVGVVPMFFE